MTSSILTVGCSLGVVLWKAIIGLIANAADVFEQADEAGGRNSWSRSLILRSGFVACNDNDIIDGLRFAELQFK